MSFDGSILIVTPTSLDFGDVTVGSYVDLTLRLLDDGYDDLIATQFLFSNPLFSLVLPSLPFTITAHGYILAHIRFSPTGVSSESGTLTIDADAMNQPILVALLGAGVAAGSGLISIDPSSWDFGTQKAGVPTAEKLFTITNTGTIAVNVSGITFAGPFSAGATFPGGFPVAIAAAGILIFGIIYTASIEGFETEAAGCEIASDALNNPHDLVLSGTGYLITPAYVLIGSDTGLLLAFGNVVKQMDPNDLNCEENASFERIHVFEVPSQLGSMIPLHDVEKTLLRVGFKYEDKGSATLKVSATVRRQQDVSGTLTQLPQTVGPVAVRLGTATADDWPLIAMADLEIRHELIQIKVLREANAGKVSLIDYTPKFEPMGEVVEEK